MTAAELFLTVPFAWGYVAYALQSGSIQWSALWRFTTIERDDRPVAYWLAVGFVFLYGVLLIVLGLNREEAGTMHVIETRLPNQLGRYVWQILEFEGRSMRHVL